MADDTSFYEQFARIGKALASARRIELLDLLCQGERSVEALARTSGMTVTNTSQHLQVLREARLTDARREGARVIYSVGAEDVCRFFFALRELARAHLAEVEQLARHHVEGGDVPAARTELLARAERDAVVVLDVRPRDEYLSGHIPGAVSVPLEELEKRFSSLRRNVEIIAYGRGPYCLLAPRAVGLLRERGFRARRLEDGFPEWRLAGFPVVAGDGQRSGQS